jgi:hypothetical protein
MKCRLPDRDFENEIRLVRLRCTLRKTRFIARSGANLLAMRGDERLTERRAKRLKRLRRSTAAVCGEK